MDLSHATIWLIIALLGLGTFLIRFSFLGLFGGRELPEWLLRHLRYTPVAIMPAMVAPLVVWPAATGGQPDLARVLAAFAALGMGYWTKNVLIAIVSGAVTLAAGLYFAI